MTGRAAEVESKLAPVQENVFELGRQGGSRGVVGRSRSVWVEEQGEARWDGFVQAPGVKILHVLPFVSRDIALRKPGEELGCHGLVGTIRDMT